MSARLQIGTLLKVDAGNVHVRQDGPADGKPVVLLHGFMGSMHWFDRLTPLLADTCRVTRIDLLGHGCTGGHTGLDAASQARMVASVLGRLGVTDAAAIGHSFGADVAVALAERSKRVSRIVIIAQAPDYSYATFPPGDVLLARPILGPVLHRLAPPAAVRSASRIGFAPGFRIGSAMDDRNRCFWDHAAMAPAMYRTVLVDRKKRLAARPLDVQVREIALPTLVILGRHDQFYDCDKTLARYAAVGASVEIVEGAGHSPNIERPQQVSRLIGDFLSAGTGRPSKAWDGDG